MQLHELLRDFLEPWPETIEFKQRIWPSHIGACLLRPPESRITGISSPWSTAISPGHSDCDCPSEIVNAKEIRMQPPLVDQIHEHRLAQPVKAKDSDGGGGGKPKSRPPGNLVDPDELQYELKIAAEDILLQWLPGSPASMTATAYLRRIRAAATHATADQHADAASSLHRYWRRAMVMLGYQNDWVALDNSSCHACDGGQLRVERHQPRVVECVDCGHHYPSSTWVELLTAKDNG